MLQAMHVEDGETRTQGAEAPQASRQQLDLVTQACEIIDAQEGEGLTLTDLADRLGVSSWHLQKLFKRVTGVTPKAYAAERRGRLFREELKSHGRVAEATYGAGYGSSSRVYENAARRFGMTPATYAKGGKGARIVYGMTDSPLGRLLVAATGRGICFVALGEEDSEIEQALRQEFPAADSIERDQMAVEAALAAVVDYLDGTMPHVDLPLDVQATAFQRRVWEELLAIPAGETKSYSEIAEALGLGQAQRAVGSACGRNPVSLLIPCHRAVRSDGHLGGYRWGLPRKEKLLRQEASRGL